MCFCQAFFPALASFCFPCCWPLGGYVVGKISNLCVKFVWFHWHSIPKYVVENSWWFCSAVCICVGPVWCNSLSLVVIFNFWSWSNFCVSVFCTSFSVWRVIRMTHDVHFETYWCGCVWRLFYGNRCERKVCCWCPDVHCWFLSYFVPVIFCGS